jgi:hypothetical protein|tara:strand:- start:935 stop:1141 length:207 start_codon:yes stop_codon:yes gene_type:complete
MKMSDKAKARLKKNGLRKCSVCNTRIRYVNPMAKCLKCKKDFCYDHITGVVGKRGIENYCDKHLNKKI